LFSAENPVIEHRIGRSTFDGVFRWNRFKVSWWKPMQDSTPSTRLLSLDAFRGATIAAMILVNSPGTYRAVYPQLRHAVWHGWTLTDMIFPFFLFIVGVTTVLSFARRMRTGATENQLLLHVLKRSLILFGLGLFMNGFPIFHLSTLRIPGVLQRIALCFFFTALIVLKTRIRTQVLCTVGLLISYWLMMEFIPVPEIGAGVYEPGRNFAAYIDSLFLTDHMWSATLTWDPEGLISTIPAVATTMFGALTGHWIGSDRAPGEKTAWMFGAGWVLLLLGLVVGIRLPINKNIWTSSFSLFMAGMAVACLAVFYWLIDVKGYRRWAKPFVIFGMNAITAYVLSEVLDTSWRFIRLTQPNGSNISLRTFIFRHIYAPWACPENASVMFAGSYVLLMYLAVWLMWKKHWFVKI
jgi:predicted acyltransferase